MRSLLLASLFVLGACSTANEVDSSALEDQTSDAARECLVIALCVGGYHFNDNACRCLPDAGGPGYGPGNNPGEGTGNSVCNDNICGAQEYCCNQSCGICAPIDGFCIQIACD